jgi:hypothetical protein
MLMTKLLERALEAVRRLPADTQDEIARAMLALAGDEGEPEPIDPAHLPDVLESLAQANAVSSQPTLKSRPPFAASIDEAPVYAARPGEYLRHRRLHPISKPGGRAQFDLRFTKACRTSSCFHRSVGFSKRKTCANS